MDNVYKFNRVHPPLMKDYSGDVYSVASESLRETIGPATWTTQKPDNSPGLIHVKGQVLESAFELTRNIYWAMSVPPEHFAEDITKTVTVISGVSETQKHTMERDLEVSASASGFGLSASVKASLKITDETTHEWHKEQKEEREQTFKAGYTYCTWILIDQLILKKKTESKYGGKPVPWKHPIVVTNSELICVLGTYQDKWEDIASSKVMAEDFKPQVALAEPAATVITLPTGKLSPAAL